MYKCLSCGHIFDEGEEACWTENYGEFWGRPCYEEMKGCPLCGENYDETMECAICGSEHLEDELNGGVCEDCIEQHYHDVDMCFKFGAEYPVEVKLNSFLTSMFDKDQIEEILFRELKEAQKHIETFIQKGCENFAKEDLDWFGQRLAEEVMKNENSKKQS